MRRFDGEKQALFCGIEILLALETQEFQIVVCNISVLGVAWILQQILLSLLKSLNEVIKLPLRLKYLLIFLLGSGVALT